MTTEQTVEMGSHTFELEVSDGDLTDKTSVTVEVLSPGAATRELMHALSLEGLPRQTARLAHRLLWVGARLFDRGQPQAASRVLQVCQKILLRRTVKQTDRSTVNALVEQTQQIIDAAGVR